MSREPSRRERLAAGDREMRALRRHRPGGSADVPVWAGLAALVLWVASWRIVWLEIFRWRHMTKTLRFRLPDLPPGIGVEPRPGIPVRCLRVVAIVAPVVCITAFALVVRRRR